MDDAVDTLLIDVRASTTEFQQDIEAMRSTFDSTLLDGFATAGNVLERGLLSAIRKGSLGFDDLKAIALRTINEIAAQAVQLGLDSLFSGASGQNGGGGVLGVINGALGAVLGLPGRALGGSVSPGSPYLVGERGPELFVPTSAGRVEASPIGNAGTRDVRVAIQVNTPRGTDTPVALKRSARQVASSVRRAMTGI